MAIYQIKYTNGGSPITIAPGQLNGPGGTSGVTDLDLYGQGTLNWGRGVDQNQLRILENFACPQSTTAGYLRPVNAQDQSVTDNANPHLNYNSDGVSTGINNPVRGQEWFNTTDGKMYVCTDAAGLTNGGNPVWEISGADPDLFLPLTGGVMSGNVDIVNSDPHIRMTATGTGSATRLEMYDTEGIKGLFTLIQDPSAFEPGVVDLNGTNYATNTDHLVWSKENVSATGWIARLRMQDDGLVFEKGTGGQLGNGTIRVSEPITAAHPGNTLVTKDYIDDAGYVTKAGADNVMEGPLEIANAVGGQLILSSPDSDTNHNPSVMFNETNTLRGELKLAQGPSGFPANIDHLVMVKYNGAKTNRVSIEDERVVITNDSNSLGDIATGAFVVDTYSANQGKAYSPSTSTGDSNFTLTTKDYVDTVASNYVALGGQNDGMTGSYRFGVDNADTRITGPVIKSLNNASTAVYTQIDGDTILTRSSATNKTEITSSSFLSKNGSGELSINGSLLTSYDSATNFTTVNQSELVSQTQTGRYTRVQGHLIQTFSDDGANTGNSKIIGSQMELTGSVSGNTTTLTGGTLRLAGDSPSLAGPTGELIQEPVYSSRTSSEDIVQNKTLSGSSSINTENVYLTGTTTGFTEMNYHFLGNTIQHRRAQTRVTNDDTAFVRFSNTGQTTMTLTVDDDGLQITSPLTDIVGGKIAFNTLNSASENGGGWGIDFNEGTAQTYRGGMYFQPTTDQDEIRLEFRDDTQGVTRMQLQHDRVRVNRPTQLTFNNADDVSTSGTANAMRIWRQSTKPTAVQSADGDFWIDTSSSGGTALFYMRFDGQWVHFSFTGSGSGNISV